MRNVNNKLLDTLPNTLLLDEILIQLDQKLRMCVLLLGCLQHP